MPNKKQMTLSAFRMLEQGFNFNKERIFEMYRLLSQIACLKDCPGIDNDIAKSVIKDINEYLNKWKEINVYPSGVPYCDDKIETWVEEKDL